MHSQAAARNGKGAGYMNDNHTWHFACRKDDIEEEDVLGVEIDGSMYAVYRIEEGYFATEGLCSHERSPLADGFVSGDFVECAKHNARFHIPTGKALRKPATVDLTTYPVKIEGEEIYLGIPD